MEGRLSDWKSMFDGSVDVSPPLDDTQLADIPNKRGVVMLAAGDEPIVMITAANIRSRVSTRLDEPLEDRRSKSADLREITTRVYWKLCTSHFETDLRFMQVARAIWPADYGAMLPWKPAWFVHVDPQETYPHYSKSRKLPGGGVRSFGPFISGRDADQFISAIQDGFDLCRDLKCLRQSPNAHPCSYAQMRRCLSPCDGSIPMSQYAEVVARSADFAAGPRDAFFAELNDAMQAAAGELKYEQAAAIKGRIERLKELNKALFRFARPFGEFGFVVVQPGANRQTARVFAVNGDSICDAGEISYPLEVESLDKLLAGDTDAWGDMRRDGVGDGPADVYAIGLVSSYLFRGQQRRGLIVRRSAELTGAQLGDMIEAASDDLHLRERKRRHSKAADESSQKK